MPGLFSGKTAKKADRGLSPWYNLPHYHRTDGGLSPYLRTKIEQPPQKAPSLQRGGDLLLL